MKNIRIITVLLSLLFIVSCNEEYADYTAPDDLSDVSWYMSVDPYAKGKYNIEADSFISFLDLSQGAVSHEWTIEEGNFFLNERFVKGDSLDLFINEDAGLTIIDDKAHVLFKNIGLNKVRLVNKFEEFVSYYGNEQPLDAVYEDGLWVIDTTFTFDVFGKLLPAFKVLQDDVEVLNITEEDLPDAENSDSWPVVDVEAGKTLTFVDLTTVDRPSGRSWSIPDGVPASSALDTVSVKFYKLGLFEVGEMKSIRSGDFPATNTVKLIPLKVNVIPSSEPFEFDGVLKEAEDETISFRVSGEIEPFTDEEASFTVNVKNEDSGFDQNIAVVSAKVSPDNSTFIELSLAQPIYNSDVVTISYSGGNIKSTDTRDLIDFGPVDVQMFFGNNILTGNSWSGFEQSHTALNRAYAGPNGAFWVGAQNVDDPTWSRVTSAGTDKVFEGTGSMRFSVDGITKNAQLHTYGLGTIDIVPAGTYKVSLMVYLEPGNTMGGFWTWGGGVPPLASEAWDLTDLERGKWVKIEHIITTPALEAKKRVTFVVNTALNPNANTGRQTMFIDNLSFVEVEVR